MTAGRANGKLAKSKTTDFQDPRSRKSDRAREVTPKVQEIALYCGILGDNDQKKQKKCRETAEIDYVLNFDLRIVLARVHTNIRHTHPIQ